VASFAWAAWLAWAPPAPRTAAGGRRTAPAVPRTAGAAREAASCPALQTREAGSPAEGWGGAGWVSSGLGGKTQLSNTQPTNITVMLVVIIEFIHYWFISGKPGDFTTTQKNINWEVKKAITSCEPNEFNKKLLAVTCVNRRIT